MHFRLWILALASLSLAGCGASKSGTGAFFDMEGGAGGEAGSGGSGAQTGGAGGLGGSGGVSTGGLGGSTGGAGGVGGGATCTADSCTAPAICDATTGVVRCVCPAGGDVDDGSGECEVDPCVDGTADCDPHATCTVTDDGYECACEGPAYVGDGQTCACGEGYVEAGDVCLKANIGTCGDGDECASGNCVGGICCAVACDSPGTCEQLAGTVCLNGDSCRYGAAPDDSACDPDDVCAAGTCFEGACEVAGPKDCSDGLNCTVDTCDPETGACLHEPVPCDDENPCTDDSCDEVLGCRYVDNDVVSCTDGNPCTVNACSGGNCTATAVDCSAESDQCNAGLCVDGGCQSQPTNVGGGCTQGLTACDLPGQCDASGVCVSGGSACGTLATSCAPCDAGGDCFNGRLCTCPETTGSGTPVDLVNGVCVPNTDECLTNPCDPLATCHDPTPDELPSGDYVCTCPSGYEGDGRLDGDGCTDIDECASGDPCGPGVAEGGCDGLSPPGSYSCTCAPGFALVTTETGPFCTCDLSGTYALLMTTGISWPEAPAPLDQIAIEASGDDVEVHAWSLRHHTVQSDGTMRVETVPCGGTSPYICSPYFSRAFGQFQGNEIWGRASTYANFPARPSGAPPEVGYVVDIRGTVPGGEYREPELTALAGIRLANPSGPWPPCRACVGVPAGEDCSCGSQTHTVTNFAAWEDTDDDTNLGISTWAVRNGGESFGGTGYPDPPYLYPAESGCPRLSGGTPYPWGAWPATDDGLAIVFNTFQRTLEWRGASRVQSALKATEIELLGGACAISGRVIGPDMRQTDDDGDGLPRADARVGGCRTCGTTFNCQEATGNCNSTEINFFDTADQVQEVTSSTFNMIKLDGIDLGEILADEDEERKALLLNLACIELRYAYCPDPETCLEPPPED
jgi:hypothetical protein